MNLKNYTSSVPAINSINKIEHKLVQAGAKHIAKTYENSIPSGMMFQLEINNLPISFKLPAKIEKVYEYMKRQRSKPPNKLQDEALKRQSLMTAWKLLADWVEVQISLVLLEQAEATEVFLPYICNNNGQTFFEQLKETNFKMLEQ